jgi:hypothetical protein
MIDAGGTRLRDFNMYVYILNRTIYYNCSPVQMIKYNYKLPSVFGGLESSSFNLTLHKVLPINRKPKSIILQGFNK